MSYSASELNEDSCLSLRQILKSFGAPISEEQAWAIVYESAKCLESCLANSTATRTVTEARHLFLHREGFVHCSTFGVASGPATTSPSKRKNGEKDEREREKYITSLVV
jgi:hypothetical protein